MRRALVRIVLLMLAVAFVLPTTSSAATAPSAWRMLKEQVASQEMIGSLMGTLPNSDTHVAYITFGKASKSSVKAIVPITVYTRGGQSVKGTLVLYKYNNRWYLYSITRGGMGSVSQVAMPAGISSTAVSNSIAEQRGHQWMLTGILNGGYKKLTVIGRGENWNTRRDSIRLSGGSRPSVLGRVYAYRKTATNGKAYWFISTMK